MLHTEDVSTTLDRESVLNSVGNSPSVGKDDKAVSLTTKIGSQPRKQPEVTAIRRRLTLNTTVNHDSTPQLLSREFDAEDRPLWLIVFNPD